MTDSVTEQRPRRALWTALAVLTALVIVALAGVQAWGALIHQTEVSDSYYHHQINALTITGDATSVSVSPGPADEVHLHSKVSWALSKPQILTSWQGNTLVVDVICERSSLYFSLECDSDINLQVPAQVSVTAAVSSGSIAIQDLDGGVNVNADSGSITLDGDRGTLWAQVQSGTLTGTNLTAANVTASAASGTVNLVFAAAPQHVDATARSGEVGVIVPSGTRYRVDSQSYSGSLHIDPQLNDDTSPRVIHVQVDSGSASVGY